MKADMGHSGKGPYILNLDTKWRLFVSLALWPLYTWGKRSQCSLYRSLSGAQN